MKGRFSVFTVAVTYLYALCVGDVIALTSQPSVVVNTHYGALRGFQTVAPQPVNVFLGVPFAAPPVGNLRFHKPVPPRAWSGVKDATVMGPMCPQVLIATPEGNSSLADTMMDEDCLHLNVYAPQMPAGTAPSPVMVFIHGGAYAVGAGGLYNGTFMATKHVVVVTINYRLSALGFLCTEDAASVGNYGLWDQVAALRWIQTNIRAFGGDPSKVTVFGQSAGSGSISLLTLSHQAKGLFHQAIMESGCSLSPWAMEYPTFAPRPRDTALTLASRLGCPGSDTQRLVACLRDKPATDIVNMASKVQPNPANFVFRPVAETTFGQIGLFSAVPKVILLNGWFNNITTMRGFNHDELSATVEDPEDDGVTLDEFKAKVKDTLNSYYLDASPAEVERMLFILLDAYVYRPNIPTTDHRRLRQALVAYSSDFGFTASVISELELVSRYPVRPQYLYRFSYRTHVSSRPQWEGVAHGAELPFVFGFPFYQDLLSGDWAEQDRHATDVVQGMWTDFAKHGQMIVPEDTLLSSSVDFFPLSPPPSTPTPQPINGVTWQPWSPQGRQFLEINSTVTLKTYPLSPHDAWTAIYSLPDNPDGGLQPPSGGQNSLPIG